MTSTDTPTRTAYRSDVEGLTLSVDDTPIPRGEYLPEDTPPEKLKELLRADAITAIPLRQVIPGIWASESEVAER